MTRVCKADPPTHPPQPTHVVTADLHQHVWVCEDENLYQFATEEPCSVLCQVEQESTKNPEQSSKSLFERGQKVNIFSDGIFSLKYEQEGGAREPYPILYQVPGT